MKATIALTLLLLASAVLAQPSDNFATLRGGPIAEEAEAPRIAGLEDKGAKHKRAYPMQPPIIPHKVEGYRVNLKTNRCMTCHSRRTNHMSGAPMISVTHYTDRDGNFLADVSPRRYFCQQCHVAQTDVEPALANEFVDIDVLLRAKPKTED